MLGLMRRGRGAAAAEFAENALQIRLAAQKEHAEEALEALRQFAINPDTAVTARVGAWREYLEQVLGKPEAPPADGVEQEDGRAVFAAYSGMVREKLRRIAQSGTESEDTGRAHS